MVFMATLILTLKINYLSVRQASILHLRPHESNKIENKGKLDRDGPSIHTIPAGKYSIFSL